MIDLEADLRDRWRPSADQIERADRYLANGFAAERPDGDRGVYTAHLLVNKGYGFWTVDVEVVPVEGLFVTREAVLRTVERVAGEHYRRTGINVTGGYAWHSAPGKWAVWEDICFVFPEPEWSRRRLTKNP